MALCQDNRTLEWIEKGRRSEKKVVSSRVYSLDNFNGRSYRVDDGYDLKSPVPSLPLASSPAPSPASSPAPSTATFPTQSLDQSPVHSPAKYKALIVQWLIKIVLVSIIFRILFSFYVSNYS